MHRCLHEPRFKIWCHWSSMTRSLFFLMCKLQYPSNYSYYSKFTRFVGFTIESAMAIIMHVMSACVCKKIGTIHQWRPVRSLFCSVLHLGYLWLLPLILYYISINQMYLLAPVYGYRSSAFNCCLCLCVVDYTCFSTNIRYCILNHLNWK